MFNRPTITLGICLAAGLAAGIGLARPGASPAAAPQGQVAPAGQQQAAGTDPYRSATAAPAAPAPQPETRSTIAIAGFDFGQSQTVAAGSVIDVSNRDGAAHTLTAADGSFDTGTIAGGQTAGLTAPTAPGTYAFFCSIHPSMQGTLTVG